MPKYARHDPTIKGQQKLIAFYDTDFAFYPNLPPKEELIELTEEQWWARIKGNLHCWAATDGKFHLYEETDEDTYTKGLIQYRQALGQKLGQAQDLVHKLHEAILVGEFEVNGPEAKNLVQYCRYLRSEIEAERPDITKSIPDLPEIKF